MPEDNQVQEVRIVPDKNYELSGAAIMSISQTLYNLPYSQKRQIENIINVLSSAKEVNVEHKASPVQ